MTKTKKPIYKKWWAWIIVLFIVSAIFPREDEAKDIDDLKKVETSATKEETKLSEEEKVASELKAKEAAAAKEKPDAEKKEKEAVAEKEYYINEVSPQIEVIMGVYDRIWSDIWQPTFEGLGNGSVDVYTAYQNMKDVEARYDALRQQIINLDGDKLSKDNKKLLKDFKTSLGEAASLKGSAASKAKKMFDKGDFAPSEIDKIMATVGYADTPMMNAAVSKVSIDVNLGIVAE